jgi:hypothetical protein
MALHLGSPIDLDLRGLAGRGFKCADPSPTRADPGVSVKQMCYRYDHPTGPSNGEGTQVILTSADGKLVDFLIRSCGSTHKFACEETRP